MSKKVVAQVILAGSVAPADEPLTAENIDRYRASPEVAARAKTVLESNGVRVVQEGATSLSIEAEPEQFERLFHTRLEPASKSVDVAGQATTMTHYRAVAPITVPAELQDVVADVVLATPPDFFG